MYQYTLFLSFSQAEPPLLFFENNEKAPSRRGKRKRCLLIQYTDLKKGVKKRNKKIGRSSALSGLRLPLLTMLVYRTPRRNV